MLPVGFIKATPEFGLKVRIVRDSAAVGTGRYNKAREVDAVNTGFNHRTSCVEYSCSVRRMPAMISLKLAEQLCISISAKVGRSLSGIRQR